MKCDRDCYNCPFLPDPYDTDRYVCIKCGYAYSFRRLSFVHPVGVAVLTIVMIVLLEQGARNSQNTRPATQENSRQNYSLIAQQSIHKFESSLNRHFYKVDRSKTRL